MDPIKVPQNLELEDVLAWGLGAMDLVCLVLGGLGGWWAYLVVPAPFGLRVGLAAFIAGAGAILGVGRAGDHTARAWLRILAAYLGRARLLVYRAEGGER